MVNVKCLRRVLCIGVNEDQQVIRLQNYLAPDSSESPPTVAKAVTATLAGSVFDSAANESGGRASRILDAKTVAAETARAASEIWCSELPALKSLLKAFVTIGASGTAASEAAGASRIPQERYFTFSMQQVNRGRFAEAQQQAVAKKSAKECTEGIHERFEICIDLLKEKRSLSTPCLSAIGTLR
jgi:hypothetical protein